MTAGVLVLTEIDDVVAANGAVVDDNVCRLAALRNVSSVETYPTPRARRRSTAR